MVISHRAENLCRHRACAVVARVWRRLPLAPRWLLLLVALVPLATGCRTFGKRGPSAESMATCRQLTQQAIVATERSDWKRAESLLGRAVTACPADVDARRQYGEALWHRGATSTALAQFEEARHLSPEDVGLAVRTGELYLELGRATDGGRLAEESLRLDPKFAPAWTLRGRVAAASGQARQALADYQRSLGYAPDDHDVALLVAEAYRQLNEPERALLTLQSVSDDYAAGEQPQRIMYLEGLALAALGRHDDAAALLAQAARRDRPNAEILYRLAEAEWHCGRAANAQTNLQEALALDPNHGASRALWSQISARPNRSTIAR
jgi:tetratricopeptide (TPR) repeat protein